MQNTGTGKRVASAVVTVGWVAEAVRSASATSASEWAIVTLPPSSVIVIVTL